MDVLTQSLKKYLNIWGPKGLIPPNMSTETSACVLGNEHDRYFVCC